MFGDFLRKLFKRKPPTPGAQPASPTSKVSRSAEDAGAMVTFYDEYGRQLQVSKEVWRTDVLPGNIKNAWNDPDRLYQMVESGLNDNFIDDIADASRRLYELDPKSPKCVCARAIVLMEQRRFDQAEQILNKHLQQVGPEAAVLGNLSQIHELRGDKVRAQEFLWKSLEADPNFRFSFSRFLAQHQAQSGNEGAREALRKLTLVRGSWLAQCCLARESLEQHRTSEALDYYREALAHAPRPVPPDLLTQMGGDLGHHGELREVVRILKRWFDPSFHGLYAGNNLIKAYVDLGQLDQAAELVNTLYRAKRPDWVPQLQFWESEISKGRLDQRPAQENPSIRIGVIEGPVWLPERSPATNVFGRKPSDELVISVLSGTIEGTERPDAQPRREMATLAGRAARTLPLLIAEQLHFRARTRIRSLVPVVEGGMFALFGKAYEDSEALKFVEHGGVRCDAVISTHLFQQEDGWLAEVRLLRTNDQQCVGAFKAEVRVGAFGGVLTEVLAPLIDAIEAQLGIQRVDPPALYQLPDGPDLSDYLLRLEQLLALRCAFDGESAAPDSIRGEREIIQGNINLCLNAPTNPTTRILLCQTTIAMSRVAPEILPEFRDSLRKLQNEHPLNDQLQPVAEAMLAEALA